MGMDVYGLNPNNDSPAPAIDWESSPSQEQVDKYLQDREAWEERNHGAYFRNNVWWWRPLWDYVCAVCDDILSEEQQVEGHWNNGFEYDATVAVEIADRLQRELESGKTAEYEASYQASLDDLDEGDMDKWYPFSAENVKEFQLFCRASGGFQIC